MPATRRPDPDAEKRLEALWASLPVGDRFRAQVSQIVTTHSRRELEELNRRAQGLRSIRDEVPTTRSRLLTGYEEGAIPPDIYLEMTEQLNTQASTALEELQVITAVITALQSALRTLANEAEADPANAYRAADPPIRQQLNQAVFTAIHIGREPDQINHTLA